MQMYRFKEESGQKQGTKINILWWALPSEKGSLCINCERSDQPKFIDDFIKKAAILPSTKSAT
jgi:hypothetical protein